MGMGDLEGWVRWDNGAEATSGRVPAFLLQVENDAPLGHVDNLRGHYALRNCERSAEYTPHFLVFCFLPSAPLTNIRYPRPWEDTCDIRPLCPPLMPSVQNASSLNLRMHALLPV